MFNMIYMVSNKIRHVLIASVLVFSFLGIHVHVDAAGIGYSVSDTGNWNIRFDGPEDTSGLSTGLSYASLATGDLNQDGITDVIVGARRADANGREDSGSLYIIYGGLLTDKTGTGNIIDLEDSSTYTLRIDGASVDDEGQRRPVIADFNNDGLPDLAFAAYRADNNSRSNSGSVYVLYNELVGGYTTTGNTLDLASSSNYHVRIDGSEASEQLGNGPVIASDVNYDGVDDLVVGTTVNRFFVIYSTIFNTSSGTGNTFDLAVSTNYNIKFLGRSFDVVPSFGTTTLAERLSADSIKAGDIDGDGREGLLIGASFASYNDVVDNITSGSIYIIKDDLLSTYSGTGNDIIFASSTRWNYRFDGVGGWDGGVGVPFFRNQASMLGDIMDFGVGDIDGDNRTDIVFAEQTSYNGRDISGSHYIVKGSFLDDYTGTGNTFLTASTTSWNLRFDGAEAGDRGITGAEVEITDVDNNGIDDLVFSTAVAQFGDAISTAGKVYVVFDSTIESLDVLETGNIADLADTDNFDIRYDGIAADDWLGGYSLMASDVNNDGLKDLLIGAWGADSSNASETGVLYAVYYFPHTFTIDDISDKRDFTRPFQITGNVSAPNNPTHIAAVQWGHQRGFGDDSGEFINTWHDCLPDDGAFDSNNENFLCNHSALDQDNPNFISPHQVFFRARDEKGIYTPISLYPTDTYTIVDRTSTSQRIGGGSSGYSQKADDDDENEEGGDDFVEEDVQETQESGSQDGHSESSSHDTGEQAQADLECSLLQNDLRIGDEGEDVAAVQQFLREEGLFTHPENTGYFGPLTQEAVSNFQERHAQEILAPWGIDQGTGWWYKSTPHQANVLRECAPPPTVLDNGVILN